MRLSILALSVVALSVVQSIVGSPTLVKRSACDGDDLKLGGGGIATCKSCRITNISRETQFMYASDNRPALARCAQRDGDCETVYNFKYCPRH
ncbi:hypothetical protein BGZ67_002654 [Mortierella alpina]|nr:hypothetical protein BGZ67_002654 [Mortierella alpina]